MEENVTAHSFSDNIFTAFDYDMNTNTNNAVATGNLLIRLLATSHIMFKIGEYGLSVLISKIEFLCKNEVLCKVCFYICLSFCSQGGGSP